MADEKDGPVKVININEFQEKLDEAREDAKEFPFLCGMCLKEKDPDICVPVCSWCASKLQEHFKRILVEMNEISKLLYHPVRES